MADPRAFNHVGISVPDIDAAVAWYRDVLNCSVLYNPGEATDDGTHFGAIVKDIFGPQFGGLKIAHLTTVDGTGIELFQFIKPKNVAPPDNFDYWRTGIFHICITATDIDEMAAKIEKAGGKLRSKIWQLFPNKPYRVCYCQDPWGIIIELNTHSYEQIWSNLETPHQMG
jgi:catechol 2,3-dioxygenase-like lactoylglutathione lyase family enzyme